MNIILIGHSRLILEYSLLFSLKEQNPFETHFTKWLASGISSAMLLDAELSASDCLITNHSPPLLSLSLTIFAEKMPSLFSSVLIFSSINKREAASMNTYSSAEAGDMLAFLQHFSSYGIVAH